MVHPVLQHLADTAADAEGIVQRPVPRLAPHALADQLTVLASEALAVVAADAAVDIGRRLADLRRAL